MSIFSSIASVATYKVVALLEVVYTISDHERAGVLWPGNSSDVLILVFNYLFNSPPLAIAEFQGLIEA